MPPLDVVLTSWTLNWPALAITLTAGALYGIGLRTARRRGIHWPWWRTATFYGPGLGSFAVLSFGFPGVYSHDLRWAFTLKVTSYLFLVPLLVAAGKPLTLGREVLGAVGQERLQAFLGNPVIKVLSNTVVAALLGLALFTLFLTPAFHTLRTDPVWDAALNVLVPLAGMLMVVPIIEDGSTKDATSLIIVEFIFVFIELVADALPGVLMRISPHVLDGAAQAVGGLPDGKGSISFDGLKRYIGVDVRSTPGQTGVLAISLLAVAGLVTSLHVNRRRVWVRTGTHEDGRTMVEYGLLARGEDHRLAGEAAAIRETLTRQW